MMIMIMIDKKNIRKIYNSVLGATALSVMGLPKNSRIRKDLRRFFIRITLETIKSGQKCKHAPRFPKTATDKPITTKNPA